MSTLTSVLNKSTSITTDVILCVGVGAVSIVLLGLLPWGIVPLIGKHIPVVGGCVIGMACYHRQRSNLKNPAAKF
jgi:hypothetical protein